MKTTYFCGFFTFFRHWTTSKLHIESKITQNVANRYNYRTYSENETFCTFKYKKIRLSNTKKDGPQNILCPAAC